MFRHRSPASACPSFKALVVQKSCLKRNKQKVGTKENKMDENLLDFWVNLTALKKCVVLGGITREKEFSERRLRSMFIIDWLTAFLRLLGLSSKKARIVLLGFHLPVYPSLRSWFFLPKECSLDIGWTWACNCRTGQRWQVDAATQAL